jgi:hypothetical protein
MINQLVVCVSHLVVREIKKIIKDSEIMKYAVKRIQTTTTTLNLFQGRRRQMAAEEQRWKAGA